MPRQKRVTSRKPRWIPRPGGSILPYGWRHTPDSSTIEEDQDELKTVQLAKDLAKQGLGCVRIAHEFANRGVPNRAGNSKWEFHRIRSLVNYSGLSPFWKHRKAKLDAARDARLAARANNAVPIDDPDPVKWGQAFLVNRDGAPRSYWSHQIEDLHAQEDNIIHLDGRDVGKTANLTTLALHYALTTPKGSALIAAALNGQLISILEEIEFQLEQNPKLDDSIAIAKNGHRKILRSPYPRIEFANGCVLYFRPAGPYGEAFRSLHVQRIWVDEAAWLSEEAWRALRQCLKARGKMRVYSTPNGVRNTTYYRLTQSPRWRVFRWPSWLNPDWDKQHETDLLEFYGGHTSPGWQHEVAGEHGAPSYGAFHPEQFTRCLQDIHEYRKVVITGQELADCADEQQTAARLEMLLGLTPARGTYFIGGDLGYTHDPTELLVFQEYALQEAAPRGPLPQDPDLSDTWFTKPETRNPIPGSHDPRPETQNPIPGSHDPRPETRNPIPGSLRLVLRVHMESVPYPHIAQTLAILDQTYAPIAIGIDNGGNGLAVIQELLTLDKYKDPPTAPLRRRVSALAPSTNDSTSQIPVPHSCFHGRLHGFDFGSVTTFPLPDGTEARKRTKELMTSLINGALQRREIAFPIDDREIEDQFLTQTYSLNNGIIVYSKGNDHIIDATRCAVLAREKTRDQGLFADGTPTTPILPPRIEPFGAPWRP